MALSRTLVLAGALWLAAAPDNSLAQAIHLPSTYRPNIPKGAPLLGFTIKDNTAYPSGTKIMVHDDQIVLMIPSRGPEFYPIGNRTLSGIANDIQSRHERTKLEVTAYYPFHSARELPETPEPVELGPNSLKAEGDRPQVAFGFGGVFSLASDPAADDEGLLDQTGFQLDLVGSYQWAGPRAPRAGAAPNPRGLFEPVQAFWQVRLGLNSDQSLNVVTEAEQTDAGGENPTVTDFMGAVEQADQFAMTTQLDLVLPVRSSAMEFVLVPEVGITWSRAEPYQFPLLPRVLGGEPEASEGFFNAAVVEDARHRLNATQPLTSFGATSIVRFKRDGRVAYYLGAGPVWTDVTRRTIHYRRFPGNAPEPGAIDGNFIGTTVRKERVMYGRMAMGARIGGTLDLRAEALIPGGITAPDGQPRGRTFDDLPQILRLVIVKEFPATR